MDFEVKRELPIGCFACVRYMRKMATHFRMLQLVKKSFVSVEFDRARKVVRLSKMSLSEIHVTDCIGKSLSGTLCLE